MIDMKKLLEFMQSQDRNGSWMEWYDEIQRGESEFDRDYVLKVLQRWYDESGDEIYKDWMDRV